MYLGSIVEIGSKARVFGTPQHPYSKALLSSALVPDPTVRKMPYLLSGEIPSPINLPSGCPLTSRCPEAAEHAKCGFHRSWRSPAATASPASGRGRRSRATTLHRKSRQPGAEGTKPWDVSTIRSR